MTGVPSAAAARYCSITYGRIFSRICMTLTIAAYDSSPNIQISLEADCPHLPAGPGGQGGPERAPCSRNSGQNAPHWNQRTTSSLKSAEVVSPLPKPPMSVVQYGMPVLHNKRSAPGVGAGRQQCEGAEALTAHDHVEAGAELLVEVLPRRLGVPRPHRT